MLPALVDSLWKALNLGETSMARKEVRDTKGKATVTKTCQEDQVKGPEKSNGISSQLRADPELFPSEAGVQVCGSGLGLGSHGGGSTEPDCQSPRAEVLTPPLPSLARDSRHRGIQEATRTYREAQNAC